MNIQVVDEVDILNNPGLGLLLHIKQGNKPRLFLTLVIGN